MNKIILAILLLSCTVSIKGQQGHPEDSVWVEHVLLSGDTTTLFYARQLLDRPYVGHTLEVNDNERLVVNTRQLDCTTLVETVAALTLCAKNGKGDYGSFCHYLQQMRYRQGHIDGYASRLHYFSDWIDDNTAMGLLRDIATNEPPFTAVQTLNVNFMSQHPEAYKALRKNPRQTAKIAAQEKRLTGRKYRFIKKQQVADYKTLRKYINDGDIIAITTSKRGLDIAHLGFAVWRDDGVHLLNASQLHKKVVEEPMRLHEYLAKHPSFTGIRVIRLI